MTDNTLVMIIVDPERKDDDMTYLLSFLKNFDNMEIWTIENYDFAIPIIEKNNFQFNVRYVEDKYVNFKQYAKECNFLLVMPNGLITGVPNAIIDAFNKYNDLFNVSVFMF